jgi:uncharacterized membrane protein YhaH (DUF805 family)
MQGADGPQTRPAMTVQESVKQCLWKYADFSGRATRAEFWWWVLATTIVLIVFYGVAGFIYASGALVDALPFTLSGITFQLLTLFPSLAVTARRLHDLGRSGWLSLFYYAGIYIGISLSFLTWALVAFLVEDVITSSGDLSDVISVLGLILSIPVAVTVTAVCTAFVVSLARQGHAGLNRFGPDPRAMDSPESAADVIE